MNYKCEHCGAFLDPGERCDCIKVDKEFCKVSFRQAKNPKKQVNILAELFSVSKDVIIDILGDDYKKALSPSPVKEKRGQRTARIKAMLTADIASGMSVREAAEHVGVTYNVAANHTRSLRKQLKQARAMKEDPLCSLL